MDKIKIEIAGIDRITEALEGIADSLRPDFPLDLAIGAPLLKVAEAIQEHTGIYEGLDQIANAILYSDKQE